MKVCVLGRGQVEREKGANGAGGGRLQIKQKKGQAGGGGGGETGVGRFSRGGRLR